MIYMHRIGVLGNYENICGFAALGLEIYPVDNEEAAEETLKMLADSDFGIIYVDEELIEKIPGVLEKYKERILPAIIPVPLSRATGFGMSNVKRYVEQAVGSDIIFND